MAAQCLGQKNFLLQLTLRNFFDLISLFPHALWNWQIEVVIVLFPTTPSFLSFKYIGRFILSTSFKFWDSNTSFFDQWKVIGNDLWSFPEETLEARLWSVNSQPPPSTIMETQSLPHMIQKYICIIIVVVINDNI